MPQKTSFSPRELVAQYVAQFGGEESGDWMPPGVMTLTEPLRVFPSLDGTIICVQFSARPLGRTSREEHYEVLILPERRPRVIDAFNGRSVRVAFSWFPGNIRDLVTSAVLQVQPVKDWQKWLKDEIPS